MERITEEEEAAARKIIRAYNRQEMKEEGERMGDICKKRDDEWQAKVDSGEIIPIVLSQEVKDLYRRL